MTKEERKRELLIIKNLCKNLGSISIQNMLELSYDHGFIAGARSELKIIKKGGKSV